MLTRWQSREIGEKTKTVTSVVDVRQLVSRHWQLVLESQKVTAVHVNLNRLADKENYKCCLMRHVPGTYIWVRTIPITPTYRGASSFQLDPDDDKAIEQPPIPAAGSKFARPLRITPTFQTFQCTIRLILMKRPRHQTYCRSPWR